jgi:hypothetical protein
MIRKMSEIKSADEGYGYNTICLSYLGVTRKLFIHESLFLMPL